MATVALLGTACGQQPASAPNVSGDVSAEPTTGVAAPPRHLGPGRKPVLPPTADEGTPVGAGQIDATALPEGHPVDVSIHGDGRILTVVGQAGGCSQASAELGEQAGDQVIVTVIRTTPADEAVACTMEMRYPPLDVELAKPLGERTVVLRHEEREV